MIKNIEQEVLTLPSNQLELQTLHWNVYRKTNFISLEISILENQLNTELVPWNCRLLILTIDRYMIFILFQLIIEHKSWLYVSIFYLELLQYNLWRFILILSNQRNGVFSQLFLYVLGLQSSILFIQLSFFIFAIWAAQFHLSFLSSSSSTPVFLRISSFLTLSLLLLIRAWIVPSFAESLLIIPC